MRSRTIITLIAILVALVVATGFGLHQAKQRAQSMQCGNYLTSIGSAARLWANDQQTNRFPADLLSLSNELITTKMLVCPADSSRHPAAGWAMATSQDSSFEVITPGVREDDTNHVFLRCKIHGSVLYGDGSVFVNGSPHHKF